MTKLGDVLLTIVVVLLLSYLCLLGLIYQTMTDHPSYQNTSFDKVTPLIGALGVGLIIYSSFIKTKPKYLLTRILGVCLVLPLIIIDSLNSYQTNLMEDKIINATFNLPNIILLIFILFSFFRRMDTETK